MTPTEMGRAVNGLQERIGRGAINCAPTTFRIALPEVRQARLELGPTVLYHIFHLVATATSLPSEIVTSDVVARVEDMSSVTSVSPW